MEGVAQIDAGVCGFHTSACVRSEDGQNVTFEIQSSCDKIEQVAAALAAQGQIDSYQEISAGSQGVLLQTARSTLTGCCAGCAVPAGLFKAMQVAAGLALPGDIGIQLTKQET